MSGIITQLRYVTKSLNEIEAKWALIGALAVSVHTEPRTTNDIDVAFIAKNQQEVATENDFLTAKSSVQLICNRGFNRGVDLAAALNDLVKG